MMNRTISVSPVGRRDRFTVLAVPGSRVVFACRWVAATIEDTRYRPAPRAMKATMRHATDSGVVPPRQDPRRQRCSLGIRPEKLDGDPVQRRMCRDRRLRVSDRGADALLELGIRR